MIDLLLRCPGHLRAVGCDTCGRRHADGSGVGECGAHYPVVLDTSRGWMNLRMQERRGARLLVYRALPGHGWAAQPFLAAEFQAYLQGQVEEDLAALAKRMWDAAPEAGRRVARPPPPKRIDVDTGGSHRA